MASSSHTAEGASSQKGLGDEAKAVVAVEALSACTTGDDDYSAASKLETAKGKLKELACVVGYAVPAVSLFFLFVELASVAEKHFFHVDNLHSLVAGFCVNGREEPFALYSTLSLFMWQVFGFMMIFRRLSCKITCIKILLWMLSLVACFQAMLVALKGERTIKSAFAVALVIFCALFLPDFMLALVKRRLVICLRVVQLALLGAMILCVNAAYMFFSMTNSDPLKDVLMSGLIFPLFHVFLRFLFEKLGMRIQLQSQKRKVRTGKIVPIKTSSGGRRSSILLRGPGHRGWSIADFHVLVEVMISMPGFLVLYMIDTDRAFTLALLLALFLEFVGVAVGLKAHETIYSERDSKTVAARVASWTLGELYSLVFAFATLALRNPLPVHRFFQALVAEFLADFFKEQYCAARGIFLHRMRHSFSWKVLAAITTTAFGVMWCVFAGIALQCLFEN